jgi:hypothetical protein
MARSTSRSTRARPSAPATPPPPPQLEMFPESVLVEPLDPQRVSGARTRVRGVWRVRYETEPRAHRVWHDRHGWYCEEHGPHCRAVGAVRPES